MTLDWAERHPVIGVVQPPALPGSPAWAGATIEECMETVAADTRALAAAGIDSVVVQNLWDGPTRSPSVPTSVAAMAVIVRAARTACPGLVGVTLDVNDGPASLAIAMAGGADFIRIKVLVGTMLKSGGLVSGCAAELAEARRRPGMPDIALVADVHDRSGVPLGNVSLADDIEGALWSGADALVITGRSNEQTLAMLATARTLVGDLPLVVGGGTHPDNAHEILPQADAVIVGVYLKRDGVESASVDPARARKYHDAARAAWAS
ncbi:MAG: btpA [Pseudonocardiales bacterium]|nr:btpA [Pseudonocardiales bacterium]